MKALLRNPEGLPALLAQGVYAEPALIPASPWLSLTLPPEPTALAARHDPGTGEINLTWQQGNEEAWLWVVQSRAGGKWATAILPGRQTSHALSADASSSQPDLAAVSAVDRYGNAGPPALLEINI